MILSQINTIIQTKKIDQSFYYGTIVLRGKSMTALMSSLKNQRGETLVTVVISVLLLTVCFLISAPAFLNIYQGPRKGLVPQQNCRDIAQNIMNEIRSNGMQTRVYRAPIRSTSVLFSNTNWQTDGGAFNLNPNGVIAEHGVGAPLMSRRFPNQRIMQWNSSLGRYNTQSPLLIFSSMNMLQSIYNSFSNQACILPQGLAIQPSNGLGALLDNPTMADYATAGYSVQAFLRIRPYNLNTEQILPCQNNLRIRPYGNVEPPQSDALNITNLTQNYRADRGFEVDVYVSLNKPASQNDNESLIVTCTNKSKFQFDRQPATITPPLINVTNFGTQISLAPGFRPGTFMACQYTYSTYNSGSYSFSQQENSSWVPCEQVRICGSASGFSITDNQTTVEFSSNANIASTCMMGVRAIAFDSIGNTSGISSQGFFQNPGPLSSGGNTGGGQGYEVAGAQFGSYSAAQQAASLTGQSIQSINQNVTTTNDAQMNGFSNNMANATAATNAAQAAVGSLGPPGNTVSSASSSVSSAQAAVGSAQAAVSAANAATASAASMTSSMGAVKDAATQAAADAKAAADAALAAAQAALAAAEAALAAAEAAENDNDD